MSDLSQYPVGLAAANAARARLDGIALRTPLVRLDANADSAEIWLKLENLQPIRSFKLRGAANAMLSIDHSALRRGVWTASAGNMAQGVAWCARHLGVEFTVAVPEGVPEAKLAAIRALGADIVVVPYLDWFRIYATREYTGMRGMFVHAFDDVAVMAGNSTIALEILEDLPDVDAAVIPYGGGGLFCGVGAVLRQLRPETRLYAAEVSAAAPLAAAVDAGNPVDIDHRRSFVDGIGGPMLFEQMWERTQPMLEGSLQSSLDEIAAAIRLLVRQCATVAEGAGGGVGVGGACRQGWHRQDRMYCIGREHRCRRPGRDPGERDAVIVRLLTALQPYFRHGLLAWRDGASRRRAMGAGGSNGELESAPADVRSASIPSCRWRSCMCLLHRVPAVRLAGRGDSAPMLDAHVHATSPELAGWLPAEAAITAIGGSELLAGLDALGAERAFVLSSAYLYASDFQTAFNPWRGAVGELDRVRAENDFTADQCSGESRLVPFCSLNPKRDYAVGELARCVEDRGMRGLKLHFWNSNLSLRDAAHRRRLTPVLAYVGARQLPVLVHVLNGEDKAFGRSDAQRFADLLTTAGAPPLCLAICAAREATTSRWPSSSTPSPSYARRVGCRATRTWSCPRR